MDKIIKFIKYNKAELLLIILILSISAISHGYNMFHYPYYESDEGTYFSQAWSLLTYGKLAPYTYWYDHAPGGSVFMALWIFLTGGVFRFGFSINSGRVLMLILHTISTLLLYLVTKHLTKSKMAAGISTFLFILSPLAIYFQRRILLDNIMIFWQLLSLYLITNYRNKLRYVILSSLCFGIAILSKESAIFFIPIYLYVLHLYSHKNHKAHSLAIWLTICILTVSLYFLYALLKNELFPTGTFLGGSNEHVSLVGTMQYQLSRGKISIFNSNSSFWDISSKWFKDDPTLVIISALSTVFTLLLGIRDKAGRVIGLLSLSYWSFLLRGGLVLEIYIIPLIPFASMSFGYICWKTISSLRTWINKPFRFISYSPLIVVILLAYLYTFGYSKNIRNGQNIYKSDQTTAQIAAVNYILSQKDNKSFYVIDNYSYLDLNLKNNDKFANAEYYWKVDGDKDIKLDVLKNNVDNIDYIAFTPSIGRDLLTGELSLVQQALNNSEPSISFEGDGWYVQMWAVKNPRRILLASWESYKRHYINGGRVIDPYQNNDTTSEGQSYALLRAAWLNDQETFDSVLKWTKEYLKQDDTMLFSWRWQGSDAKGKIMDNSTASDADQDIALALLFAYKRWGEETYLQEAKQIINAIWEHEVVVIKGIPYIIAANWANHEEQITLNPSYLSPAYYRIFAEVDKVHPWMLVVDSTYTILQGCTEAKLDKQQGVLPPEWCSLNKKNLTIKQPGKFQPQATEYGYNAFRTPWRVALDYKWNNELRAKQYLSSLKTLNDDYVNKGKIATAYQHDGKVWEDYESSAAYGGNIGYFSVIHPDKAKKIYKEKLLSKFYEDKENSYWDDPKNYYTQNWAWFGTALYTDNLPNLWTNNK